MKRTVVITVCALVISASTSSACSSNQATNALSPLRVYAFKSACFEYMFTSAMEKMEGRQSLSFNHINGRTIFAETGEAVGEYLLKSYEPGMEMEYNPSTDSYIQRKTGMAVLVSPDGRKVSLEMGKILPVSGWIACVVWLDSGSWMYVGENDVILAGDVGFPIDCISEDSLVLLSDSGSGERHVVPVISEEEKTNLLALWENRRKAREEEEKLAEKKDIPSEPEQKPVVTQVIRHAPPLPEWNPSQNRLVLFKTPPQFYYGSEFWYPAAFETMPLIVKTSSGNRIRRVISVPQLFQPGWSGCGMKSLPGGGTHTTVPNRHPPGKH